MEEEMTNKKTTADTRVSRRSVLQAGAALAAVGPAVMREGRMPLRGHQW
jgi:hypothetical protein